MRQIKNILTVLLFSVSATSLFAEGIDAGWLRTKTFSNALNPNISLIGDFTGVSGPMKDTKANRLSLRETELGLQASVDPYARADFFVSFPEGEAVELEEGYVTLLSLPWNIKARGGKFRPNFGKMNMIHPHEQPQVNQPHLITQFLGEEALNDTGAEVSRIFAPFGIFTELSYAFLNGLGKAEKKDPTTTTVTDTSGNTVTVTVKETDNQPQRQIRNFAHIARVRFYGDLTDSANVELGFSGLLHQPKEFKETKMAGADLTFRWKPLQEGLYRSFIWRTEGLYSDRKLLQETSALTGAVTTPARQLHRRGVYSYVEFQPLQRWKVGVRGDYVENPEKSDETITLQDGTSRTVGTSITRAVSPYVTFTLSEFNRFRLQYENKTLPGDDTEHRVFFQWTVILGPHGAHAF